MARTSIIPRREYVVSELQVALSRQVFENDLLREIILDYFLHPNGQLSRKCLTAARRVHSSWRRSTTDIMRKHRQPMFIVNLKKENSSADNEYIRKNGRKLLDGVMRCLKEKTCYTYCLKISADYFNPANCRGLIGCLANAGDTIVGLDITFPKGEIKFPLLESLNLPILQRLAIRLSGHRMESPPSRALGCNLRRFSFVRVLLNGATELKEFLMDGTDMLASNFKLGRRQFNMPESVCKIHLDMPLRSSDLRRIFNNNLPNLKSIWLFATQRPYQEEVIFGILNNYKDQLTTLTLNGMQFETRIHTPTLVRLPVMSELEFVWVGGQCWELQQDSRNLQEFLPALKEMKMAKTPCGLFKKWTENSVYPTVQSVAVSLTRTDPPTQMDVPVTADLQKMQSLHISYPNIVSLEINIYCREMSGLKYIFMEMRNLTKLCIQLEGQNPMLPANHWDSLLIGAPNNLIESLRSNRDYWPMFMPNDDNELPSIRKLTQLKELLLIERCQPTTEGPRLISDMSFHFGFLRMKNLKILALHGLFMPSEEVRVLWHSHKRTIIREVTVINLE